MGQPEQQNVARDCGNNPGKNWTGGGGDSTQVEGEMDIPPVPPFLSNPSPLEMYGPRCGAVADGSARQATCSPHLHPSPVVTSFSHLEELKAGRPGRQTAHSPPPLFACHQLALLTQRSGRQVSQINNPLTSSPSYSNCHQLLSPGEVADSSAR